jgi:hypothetical protein
MTDQILLSKSIFHEREADISRTEKDDSRCEPDLKTVQIKRIHWELEAEQYVVDNTNSDARSDTI